MRRIILLGLIFMVLCIPPVLNADILQLSPSSFLISDPDEADVYYSIFGFIYAEIGSNYRTFYAALPDLPHLGTIDQMRIYYYDNDSSYLRVGLYRRKVSDNKEEMLAEWQSSGEADYQRTADIETFTYPTIKNKGYRYYIKVDFNSNTAGSDINLRGIRFRYYPPSG